MRRIWLAYLVLAAIACGAWQQGGVPILGSTSPSVPPTNVDILVHMNTSTVGTSITPTIMSNGTDDQTKLTAWVVGGTNVFTLGSSIANLINGFKINSNSDTYTSSSVGKTIAMSNSTAFTTIDQTGIPTPHTQMSFAGFMQPGPAATGSSNTLYDEVSVQTINGRNNIIQLRTGGTQVSITISSFTGTSGTLTFTTTSQAIQSGDTIILSGFTGGNTGLNGQTVTALAAGLTSTTFEATVTGSGFASGTGSGQFTGCTTNGYVIEIESNPGGVTTHSNCIAITSGTIYWFSLKVNSAAGADDLYIYNSTISSQIGHIFAISDSSSSNITTLHIGNGESGTSAVTTNWQWWVIDWTNAAQPIKP